MKMFFLKSLPRSVHEEHHDDEAVPEIDINGVCKSLTVWRKSLLISCSGFTVIDSNGNLVYRVDNYIQHPREIILMDGFGKSLLTIRRCKKLRLVDSWLVYEGEVGGDHHTTTTTTTTTTTKLSKKPSFYVRKHINILQANHNHVLAYVYPTISDKRRHVYVIEGSYTHRSCKVVDESRRVVAEIKRKEANIGGISFGVEVFSLIVHPGFDHGFAMALVLLLDQMFS